MQKRFVTIVYEARLTCDRSFAAKYIQKTFPLLTARSLPLYNATNLKGGGRDDDAEDGVLLSDVCLLRSACDTPLSSKKANQLVAQKRSSAFLIREAGRIRKAADTAGFLLERTER